MADNNVFILFEEIKIALKGINGKLEELSNVINQQPQTRITNKIYLRLRWLSWKQRKFNPKIKGLLAKQWKAYALLSIVILQQLDSIKKLQNKTEGTTRTATAGAYPQA